MVGSYGFSDPPLYTSTPIQRETPSSVEITRGAKGTPQWSVKVYCEVGAELAALARAKELDALLKEHYAAELPS